MVSIREVERMIKLNNSNTQWTSEAKEVFCEDMETIILLTIQKIETNKKTNVCSGSKRINIVDVRDIMFQLVTKVVKGEEDEF